MKERIFVVQKHSARHLHYDLRLELDGVLKSFAVPKEPPLEKGLKRLAVQVDDHEIAYANFEGIIPEGNYGAGKVEIWDSGNFEMLENDGKKLVFNLNGKKMNGKYCLLKFEKAGKNNWLLFKL